MKQLLALLVGMVFVLLPSISIPEELPLWEAGIGFTGLTIPDYRGSNEQHGYILPLPYLIYRGEMIRSDRKGVYGRLFQSERIELDISLDAGVPVSSGRNSARFGMPDLDPMIQFGPVLEWCLVKDCAANMAAQFRFPVRAALATDLSRIRGIGFVSNPYINIDFIDIGPGGGWNIGFAFGPVFATERFNDYYYRVSTMYAVPGIREAYDAGSGYSGAFLVLALSKRYDHWWFGSFVRYDNLTGAVFERSPLVKTSHAVMAGFGIVWVFGQSTTLVRASL